VFSLSGKSVVKNEKAKGSTKVDMSVLPPGTYILKIKLGKEGGKYLESGEGIKAFIFPIASALLAFRPNKRSLAHEENLPAMKRLIDGKWESPKDKRPQLKNNVSEKNKTIEGFPNNNRQPWPYGVTSRHILFLSFGGPA
jgi:hypothetical protein